MIWKGAFSQSEAATYLRCRLTKFKSIVRMDPHMKPFNYGPGQQKVWSKDQLDDFLKRQQMSGYKP